MTIKTRVDSATGPVSTIDDTGFSIARDTANYGFMPFKVDEVPSLSASATLVAGQAGVNTITGSSAKTMVMPLASAAPGAWFTFRNAGNASVAHILTGSQETAGTKVFTDGLTKGSRLTLSGAVGTSVALHCDGVNFLVMGCTSGSAGAAFTIAGT